ncbi:MAG: hypothetical protein ACM3YM_12910 [Sphingomonadales bacterium]
MRASALAFLAFAAGAFASTAPAQPAALDDAKVNQLIVYGDEPCPPSTDEEITVCARRPESDRYRIPENLRGDPTAPSHESWVNRAEDLEYVGRTGIGSCTPVGPGGGIGCFEQLVREAKAERANSDEVNWSRLVEEARQARLSRIDAAAAADEARAKQQEQANTP